MNIRAIDVSKYILAQMSEECGDTISPLKLQKLLYYAQGFHLAVEGSPLFPEKIWAWEHGPVVREIWDEFKDFGGGAIPKPTSFSFGIFKARHREILDEVYRIFGQFSAWKLRNMTHAESPWADTPRNKEITTIALRDFFKTRVTEN